MNPCLLTLLTLIGQDLTRQQVDPPKLLPLVLPIEADTFVEGQWVEVIYAAQPDGDAIHVEPGERVWQIQDDLILMLGATGSPLPPSVTARASAFLWIENDQVRWGPIQIFPRRDTIDLDRDHMASQLKAGVPGLGATYLTQVAHYLAGNLASLDLVGDSYSVTGNGTVIDANGDWVGGRLIPDIPGDCVFLGKDAGLNDDGTNNHCTAVGTYALKENVSGFDNSAFGYSALKHSTAGLYNSAFGNYSLLFNSTGGRNTALGRAALYYNTTGSHNTASGMGALGFSTTGVSNSAFGKNALEENITGHRNSALGANAGTQTDDLSNTTALGYFARTTASNQVRVGNSSVSSIGGQVAWSTLSDGRFKTDISDDVPGLSFILGLRPLTYQVDTESLNRFLGVEGENATAKSEPNRVETGFIAQDVQQVAQSLGFDFNGIDEPTNAQTPYALRYATFVVPLVQAIQELKAEIDQLREEQAICTCDLDHKSL